MHVCNDADCGVFWGSTAQQPAPLLHGMPEGGVGVRKAAFFICRIRNGLLPKAVLALPRPPWLWLPADLSEDHHPFCFFRIERRATSSTQFRFHALCPTHIASRFNSIAVRIALARPMLGRTCTRRLRVAQPYVCRPCLRHQLRPPPARSLAPLDAFRAAPYHSSIALRRDAATALADEPKPEPSPPLTKVVTDGNKKKKQSKKGTKKQGKEDTKQQLIRKCPSDPPSPLASPAVEEGNATIDTQPQAIEKSVIRPMKLTKRQRLKLRKEQRAAKKASEEKNNQTAGSSPEGGEQRPDIGEVLHRASENGVAEVLAEAARNAKTKVKGKTLEQALLRIRKTRSKGREFADTVSAKDVQLTRKLPTRPSPHFANNHSDRCGATNNPGAFLRTRPRVIQVRICDAKTVIWRLTDHQLRSIPPSRCKVSSLQFRSLPAGDHACCGLQL